MKQTLESACPLDCPDNCSLEVDVEDGRVTRVSGSRRNPITAGFVCSKVRHFADHVYCDQRVKTPLIREQGSTKGEPAFRAAGWDEALDLVAARMRAACERSGAESILPYHYGGSNGVLTHDSTDALLFSRLGASNLEFTLCAMPTGVAATGLYGKMLGTAFDDYVHAELIVVWGANPHASNIHLAPYLKDAQGRGAKLVVVDPRRTKAAKAADLHLALRPGTDVALALAVANWLFENGRADLEFLAAHATGVDEFRRRAGAWSLERAAEVCGVSARDVERLARMYADADPALVRCGWGLERNRNGGSAVAAVLALPAVAGKFGQLGGGYTMSNSRAFLFKPRVDLADAPGSSARTIDMNRLGWALEELTDPPVEVLFVYNANPLTTVTEQERVRRGLLRADLFTVVFDAVLTDTARYADVVLPATTFLEHHELRSGYGALSMQYAPPVIDPVGEARPNYAVFADLARRLGLWRGGDTDSPTEMVERALEPDMIAALNRDGIAEPSGGTHPVQFVDVFPNTTDGKIHLVPSELDEQAPEGLYAFRADPASDAYPLALISPATERTISSTLGQLHRQLFPVSLCAADAEARGIAEGDRVRVFNALGEVVTRAHVDGDQRPGVACLSKGIWDHNTENGKTSNTLCPSTQADLGNGACFNDARVQVERV